MQNIHFQVIIFYYSIIALAMTSVVLILETIFLWQPLRILHYTWGQYFASILPGILHNATTYCLTIAMQNERPGFVTLLGYIGLVYAFLGDTLIFKESLYMQELFGICIIFTLNITVVYEKLTGTNPFKIK